MQPARFNIVVMLTHMNLKDRSMERILSLLEAGHKTPPPAPPRYASPQHTRREVRLAERLRRFPGRQKRFAAFSPSESDYAPAPPLAFPPRAPPARWEEPSNQIAGIPPSPRATGRHLPG